MPVFPLNISVSQVFVNSSSCASSNFIYYCFHYCKIPKFYSLSPPLPWVNLDWDVCISKIELICSTRHFLTVISPIFYSLYQRVFCEVLIWYKEKRLNFKVKKVWVQILARLFTNCIPSDKFLHPSSIQFLICTV